MNTEKANSISGTDAANFKPGAAEVQEDGEAYASGAEVIEALGGMRGFQAGNGLKLDHDSIINDQVSHVFPHDLLAISDIDGLLLRNLMAAHSQLQRMIRPGRRRARPAGPAGGRRGPGSAR